MPSKLTGLILLTPRSIWGIQNIMHPKMGESIFAQWYGSNDMLDVSAALMECTREAMQFGKPSL